MGPLRELVLELTDWCPQACLHCSSDSGMAQGGVLGERMACRLVDEGLELGAKKVSLGGGEPSAASSFGAVLSHVQARGLSAEVFTCGVWLAGETLEPLPDGLLAEIAALRNTKLIFSVHGPTPETHELITGVPRSFGHMTATLDAARRHGVQCEMNFVPLRPNAQLLGDVLSYARFHGVSRVSILRFVAQGRGWANRRVLQLSAEDELDFLRETVRQRACGDVQIRMGSPFNGTMAGDEIPCSAGLSKLVVQASGNILPCEVFKDDARRNWGMSVHHNTLRDALESTRIARLRQNLNRDYCMRCPIHGGQTQREDATENGAHQHKEGTRLPATA